jgi:hypothetical protein
MTTRQRPETGRRSGDKGDRRRRRRPHGDDRGGEGAATDLVDLESRDSFPASDPPSWTPVNGPRRAGD